MSTYEFLSPRVVTKEEASRVIWRPGREVSPEKTLFVQRILEAIDQSPTGIAAIDLPGGDVCNINIAQKLASEIRDASMRMGRPLRVSVKSEGQSWRIRERESGHKTTLYLMSEK